MDDTDFYLKVSETFSEIMRQVRFYPYPAVLYKIAFNKFLGEGGEVVPVKTEKKVEKKAEKEQISPSPSLSRGVFLFLILCPFTERGWRVATGDFKCIMNKNPPPQTVPLLSKRRTIFLKKSPLLIGEG